MVGSSDELETEQDSKALSYQLSALSETCGGLFRHLDFINKKPSAVAEG
jgi:hypothetical protein